METKSHMDLNFVLNDISTYSQHSSNFSNTNSTSTHCGIDFSKTEDHKTESENFDPNNGVTPDAYLELLRAIASNPCPNKTNFQKKKNASKELQTAGAYLKEMGGNNSAICRNGKVAICGANKILKKELRKEESKTAVNIRAIDSSGKTFENGAGKKIFDYDYNSTQLFIQCHLPPDFAAGEALFVLSFKNIEITSKIRVVDRDGKSGSSKVYRKSLTPERNEKLLEKRRYKNMERKQLQKMPSEKNSKNDCNLAEELSVALHIKDSISPQRTIRKRRRLSEPDELKRKKARLPTVDAETVDFFVKTITSQPCDEKNVFTANPNVIDSSDLSDFRQKSIQNILV